MSTITPTRDLIRYDLLVQEALKGVVRKVLVDAARDGLPGEHHFYISFRTDFPGVRLSQRMREKYPEEMTIVLQHQFWDLGITEHTFEVGLSFSGIPERLLIPFDALVGFFDPSVQFGLKFELNGESTPATLDEPLSSPPASVSKSRALPSRTTEPAAGAPRGAGSEPSEVAPLALKPAPKASNRPQPDASAPSSKAGKDKSDSDSGNSEEGAKADRQAGQVVSLDAFRKKT
jgi:uncharacterized protein